MALRTTFSLLSTIHASAADIATSQGYVSITTAPTMKYSLIDKAGLAGVGPQHSIPELASNWTITPAAAVAGGVYSFQLSQYLPLYGYIAQEVASYTATAADTTTTITLALYNQLLLFKDLNLTLTNNGTSLTVAGVAVATTSVTPGAPVVTIAALSNITASQNFAGSSTAQTAVRAGSVTNAGPAVFTATSHGLTVGQVISLSGITDSSTGNATVLNGTWTVTAVTTNTFTINNLALPGSTVTLTAAVLTIQPTQALGTYAAIAQQVDPSTFQSLGFSTGTTYSQITFLYSARSISDVGGNIDTETNQHTLFYAEGVTNYSAFQTALLNLVQDLTSGGAANPVNFALV